MVFNNVGGDNVFNNFLWLDYIKKIWIWYGGIQMNEFYLGLAVGIGLVLIVDWIYYFKYLTQKKGFEEKEKEMLKRMNKYFEQNKK